MKGVRTLSLLRVEIVDFVLTQVVLRKMPSYSVCSPYNYSHEGLV